MNYWHDGRRTRKPDLRGSSRDRAARKRWLLEAFGDGESADCHECGVALDFETIYVDRIVPGEQGGRYTRDNIRPSCCTCSHRQGAAMMLARRNGC